MSPFESLLRLFFAMILFCGVMPLAGGNLLCKGLQLGKFSERSLPFCVRVFFAAAGSAYLLMMIIGQVVPQQGTLAGLVLGASVVVLVELLLIAALVRKFTARILLIETAAVVMTNAAGFVLVFLFITSSAPVQAGR
jgi:hypothetical protein